MAALDFSRPTNSGHDHVGKDDDVAEEEDGQLDRDMRLWILLLDDALDGLRRSGSFSAMNFTPGFS